jgi:membrane protein required for beta-lactamase induction
MTALRNIHACRAVGETASFVWIADAGGYSTSTPSETRLARERETPMPTLLWILAVILVVFGVITLIQGSILFGLLLIVVGLLIGPGGVSLFGRRGSV